MDHNRYEDFARQLLGQNAFLLFQIDKIVSQAIKQLQFMHQDNACQKSMRVFQEFKSKTILNERIYFANYAERVVDQLSLAEN